MFPMRRPPFPPRGDPDRRPPPTPTLREMQMQAAHRGRGPGGWQGGGSVGGAPGMMPPTPIQPFVRDPLGPMCPSPKERIQLSNNDWILAGDLKVGDEVMTSEEPQKVTRVQRIEDSPRCEVLFEDSDSIVTSYSHPYFVNSKGFVEVGDLEKGDIIGDLVVKDKKPFAMGPVISLSVDKAETYMLQGGTKENPVPALSHNKTPVQPPLPQWLLDKIAEMQAAREEEMRKAAAAAARAQAAAVRTGTQARRQASRSPGGWNIGGAVDSTEALMAERDRLQQLLQTADEAMAQEIMAQIMEINKELEMAAAPGMAGGGIASLRGGGRPVDTRYAAYEARRRNRPPPQIGRALTPMGLNPSGFPYDPANQPLVARPIGPGGG
jgi:hypothetical protein